MLFALWETWRTLRDAMQFETRVSQCCLRDVVHSARRCRGDVVHSALWQTTPRIRRRRQAERETTPDVLGDDVGRMERRRQTQWEAMEHRVYWETSRRPLGDVARRIRGRRVHSERT